MKFLINKSHVKNLQFFLLNFSLVLEGVARLHIFSQRKNKNNPGKNSWTLIFNVNEENTNNNTVMRVSLSPLRPMTEKY